MYFIQGKQRYIILVCVINPLYQTPMGKPKVLKYIDLTAKKSTRIKDASKSQINQISFSLANSAHEKIIVIFVSADINFVICIHQNFWIPL